MDYIKNEKGGSFIFAIVLLFFVSLFLFSLVSWHDSIYRIYDWLEIYYERKAVELMKRDG
ncbi:hypothetical protein CSV69_15060 [Sporosarcina sp. P26b]|nr:hypothetical protein SporoP32a_00215 [Sporosarcina ureae]PIC73725.1 hypothetical protein CSV76_07335 [Sporosarcina sp. P17b]PIC94760.1 hypothetical protein CSV69_15060 [Sporosarcina sp. P26b]